MHTLPTISGKSKVFAMVFSRRYSGRCLANGSFSGWEDDSCVRESYCQRPPRKKIALDGEFVSLYAVDESDWSPVHGMTKHGGRLK